MQRRLRLPAFTLLELLVVISIIGILAAIGFGSFSQAQQQGRDAKRRGDMKAYQNCMEQCYAQNNSYASCSCTGGLTDPVNTAATGEVYVFSPTAATYYGCAKVRAGSGNFGAAGVPGNTHYCVKNLQ